MIWNHLNILVVDASLLTPFLMLNNLQRDVELPDSGIKLMPSTYEEVKLHPKCLQREAVLQRQRSAS